MCGIAGFFDADASFLSNEEQYQILLAKMGRTLKHRGPDASGTLLCNRCGLAHRRLSIIDITGSQSQFRLDSKYFNYNIPIYIGEMDDFHNLFDINSINEFRNDDKLDNIYRIVQQYL